MRFGEYLINNIESEWREQYINYALLKDILDDIINMRPDAEIKFSKQLDNEWNKCYNFINNLFENISEADITKNNIAELIKINNFIHLNREGFRKIIKKHDKNSNYKLYQAWKWKIKYNPTHKLYKAIKVISDSYQTNNEYIENTINNMSFKRKSIKYWVEKKNIIPLIVKILPHLPIYLWDEDINDHIYQNINSIYLDNNELSVYTNRINKSEGNKLIRLRWYDEEISNVFIERKIHHESWNIGPLSGLNLSISLNFLKAIYSALLLTPLIRYAFSSKLELSILKK